MSLERNTYTTPHVIKISFIMVLWKFISVDEMKNIVIVKDLSSSDVRNILQEKNSGATRYSKRSVKLDVCVVPMISESNQFSVNKNL